MLHAKVTSAKVDAVSLPAVAQKRSGDPNPQYFSKSAAVQMGGVLPYKWEAYCSANGRRIAGFPFLRSLEARRVRRYKRGAYRRTNWRCTAVLFRQVVRVGVSETLPRTCRAGLVFFGGGRLLVRPYEPHIIHVQIAATFRPLVYPHTPKSP